MSFGIIIAGLRAVVDASNFNSRAAHAVGVAACGFDQDATVRFYG